MSLLPPPPLQKAIESKIASAEWQRWFSSVRATVLGQVSGSVNNVAMFTGTGTVGNAPGFFYDASEGAGYTINTNLIVSDTLSGGSIYSNGVVSGAGAVSGGSLSSGGALDVVGASTFNLLAGTGIRLVTATSGGVLGNATTIAGSYTFSGVLIGASSGIDASSALQLISNQPSIRFSESDAAADKKEWGVTASGGVLAFFTRTDAFGVGGVWLSANRTGATVTSVIVGGGSAVDLGASGKLTNVKGALTVDELATFTVAPVFSSATASTAAAFDGSKGLISVTNTGSGNNVLSASPTFTGTILAASATFSSNVAVTGRINVNGAVDSSAWTINVASGNIVASGSGAIASYGVGVPGDTNHERMYFEHDGASGANFVVDKGGTGTYRDLAFKVGGSTRITMDTSGNLKLATAGGGLCVKEGSNATSGRAVLVAGSIVVLTTKVTANSEIQLTGNVDGGTPGWPRVLARTPGTSFTITSSNGADTSTVSWVIIEPA